MGAGEKKSGIFSSIWMTIILIAVLIILGILLIWVIKTGWFYKVGRKRQTTPELKTVMNQQPACKITYRKNSLSSHIYIPMESCKVVFGKVLVGYGVVMAQLDMSITKISGCFIHLHLTITRK